MENITKDEIAVEIPWESCGNPLEGLRDGIQNTIKGLDIKFPEWRKLGGSYWYSLEDDGVSTMYFCFRRYMTQEEIDDEEAFAVYRKGMRLDNLRNMISEFPEEAKKILSELSVE